MNGTEILDYFNGRNEHIIARIREIVDIESPSHNATASRQVADWVEQQALESGAEVSVERIAVDDHSMRSSPFQGREIQRMFSRRRS